MFIVIPRKFDYLFLFKHIAFSSFAYGSRQDIWFKRLKVLFIPWLPQTKSVLTRNSQLSVSQLLKTRCFQLTQSDIFSILLLHFNYGCIKAWGKLETVDNSKKIFGPKLQIAICLVLLISKWDLLISRNFILTLKISLVYHIFTNNKFHLTSDFCKWISDELFLFLSC